MVMGKLFKKLLRDIKQAKGTFIAIILVIAVGAFFFTGANMLADGLSSYMEVYYKDYNLTDLNVYFYQIQESDLNKFENIEGINKVEARYTFEAYHLMNGTKTNLTLHTIPYDNKINIPMIIKGTLPEGTDDIIIDSKYSEENNLQVGDSFVIATNDKEVSFSISGLCENVEHAYNIEDSTLAVPNHKLYGVAYFSEEKLIEINGSKYFNELIIDSKDDSDVEKLSKIIESKSDNLSYLYQLPKEKMISYTSLENTIMMNSLMSIAIPTLLLMVAAVILFMSMSRTVDAERTQIGIMKSLGIKNGKIVRQYIIYAILVAVLGSVLGAIFGYPVFTVIGEQQMEQLYSLPNFTLPIDFTMIIPVVLCAVVFGMIASYLSCRKILKENASAAMRPKPPKKSKKIFVERIKFIWNRISNEKKIVLRNIFLSKKRAICTSVGVILCVVLLVVAFGYSSSLDITAKTLIDDVYKYDLRVDYKEEINDDKLQLPDGIANYYPMEEISIQLNTSKGKKDGILIVTDKENKVIQLYNAKNDLIALNDAGVIISKSYADEYGLKVGDSVDLKIVMSEYQGKMLNAKIEQISLQYNGQGIYCTPTYLQNLDVDYKPKALLIELKDSKNIENVYDYFLKGELVNKITKRDDLIKSINTSVEQSYPVVIIFILCAVILSSAAIYTISSINISERSRDIATLKVLGYHRKKINSLIFTENISVTIFSIAIALPLGVIVYQNFTKVLSTVDQVVPDSLGVDTITLAIIITLLVTIISNFRLRKRVRKIDMVESLKSVE